MTGAEILSLARTQFGEVSELLISDTEMLAWLNAALIELFNDLPASEHRQLETESALGLTAGEGTLDDAWERIVAVLDGDVPLGEVPWASIRFIDSQPFAQPDEGVYAIIGTTLGVRTSGGPPATVNVRWQAPESLLVGDLPSAPATAARWHTALAHLITSYAYQQEEDHQSASTWRARYDMAIGRMEGAK